ncbi:hypothetical protein A2U01_0111927, partial [Trifolium medium]|nr:hypothetical protein [Trifolium medium]
SCSSIYNCVIGRPTLASFDAHPDDPMSNDEADFDAHPDDPMSNEEKLVLDPLPLETHANEVQKTNPSQ